MALALGPDVMPLKMEWAEEQADQIILLPCITQFLTGLVASSEKKVHCQRNISHRVLNFCISTSSPEG